MRHRFHSLCPYFAMFPETFVETWINRIVPKGAAVLDPFCGRGTTPFQALLMGREAVACDINPVAYCVTRAKTNAPLASSVRRRLSILTGNYDGRMVARERERLPEFFRYAFHQETLSEILYLRRTLKWEESDTDCMLAALVLGSLHGESLKSGAYFSNQMPRTISLKPAYAIRFWRKRTLGAPRRDVFSLLSERIAFRYVCEPPLLRAEVLRADMRELPRLLRRGRKAIRYVITSPPYFDITNFEEDQWLRLWFLGNEPNPTYRKLSRDDRHSSPTRYWEMICDFWRSLGQVLGSKAHVVIRLGAKGEDPERVAKRLLAAGAFSGRRVELVGDFEVSEIRHRQTGSFRPGSSGCLQEIDCHFSVA